MKLILMSGSPPSSVASAQGTLKFLRKPFTRENLLRCVHDTLERAPEA